MHNPCKLNQIILYNFCKIHCMLYACKKPWSSIDAVNLPTKQPVSYVVHLSLLPRCPICCVFNPSTQDSTSDWSLQLSSHINNAGWVTGFSQAKAVAKKDGVKTILFFGILICLKKYSTSCKTIFDSLLISRILWWKSRKSSGKGT